MMKNTTSRRIILPCILFLAILLCAAVFFAGSSIFKHDKPQNNFEALMNELFLEEVQADSLSLNYTLANPEDYGIESSEMTLGEYSIDQINHEMCLSENYLERLSDVNYKGLKPNQQLTYQIVRKYLESELTLGQYSNYYECLGPTTGIQAQLPILLAEYGFHDKTSIEDYLNLLPCVYDYFEDIVHFEQEKSRQGLFMSDRVAKRIIAQCEAFIADPESNFLITYFNEKILGFPGLKKKEILNYKARNAEAVTDYVIPAYELLISSLKELLGTGTNEQGLYYFPDGQKYYECQVKFKTGSDKSMEEMATALDTAIAKGIGELTSLSISKPGILELCQKFSCFPITDPEEILTDLKKDIKEDFPKAVPVNCEIKYVPASLSDYLSPAMYLVPPMDDYQNNDIYINGKDRDTLSLIYTTVAHEGYPGHLYQCVYFRSLKPSPIRNVLEFTGYDEGWATYVELYSYQYSGIQPEVADFLKTNNIIVLCMYARADIGIHYEGWNKKQTVKYVRNFIGDTKTAVRIYDTLLEEPGIYLPYAVGYLEIQELKDKAEKTLGNRFVAKDFHQFLLDTGPAQYDIIEAQLDTWIKEKLVMK